MEKYACGHLFHQEAEGYKPANNLLSLSQPLSLPTFQRFCDKGLPGSGWCAVMSVGLVCLDCSLL